MEPSLRLTAGESDSPIGGRGARAQWWSVQPRAAHWRLRTFGPYRIAGCCGNVIRERTAQEGNHERQRRDAGI